MYESMFTCMDVSFVFYESCIHFRTRDFQPASLFVCMCVTVLKYMCKNEHLRVCINHREREIIFFITPKNKVCHLWHKSQHSPAYYIRDFLARLEKQLKAQNLHVYIYINNLAWDLDICMATKHTYTHTFTVQATIPDLWLPYPFLAWE
jgi:hypothetical protein